MGACKWWLMWMDVGPAQWTGGNTHLYYRLRQSYQDFRLLDEAPCHVFDRHEWPDLLTFLQVGVLNLWNIHVVTDLRSRAPLRLARRVAERDVDRRHGAAARRARVARRATSAES